MKLGILTIHHVSNYGAVWQAYALTQVLRKLEHEVEVIDYRPEVAVRRYRQRLGQGGSLNLIPTARYWAFQTFIRRHLPLRRRCSTSSELLAAARSYDGIVVGSDQLWCTGAGSFRGYDPNFFLHGCTDPRLLRLSYAVSAGNTTSFAPHSGAIRQALSKFAALSVRDEPTQRLVGSIAGRTPTLVLDPVFLHDFGEIVRKEKRREEVLVFAEQPEPFAAIARHLASAHDLKVTSIGACSFADQQLHYVPPLAWLRRISAARVVLTDYFHGAALALQFARPVVVNAPDGKRLKIIDLFRRLELTDLVLNYSPEGRPTELFDALPVDALARPDLHQRLDTARRASIEFLERALRTPASVPLTTAA